MRGFAGQSKQFSPHPPLRGTYSRGEKVGAPRPFLIAVCNARANRANLDLFCQTCVSGQWNPVEIKNHSWVLHPEVLMVVERFLQKLKIMSLIE